MEPTDVLERTYQHANQVMSRVRADQLDEQTPCSEWNVRDLIQHMFGTVNGCAAAVGGPPPGEVEIGPDVAQQFEKATAANLSAWRAPGAFDKTVDGGGAGQMPAQMLAGINQSDIATHTWDLARATGQPTELPDDVAAAAMETTKGFMSPEVRPGRFGEETLVGPDATATEQLVAFLGRTL